MPVGLRPPWVKISQRSASPGCDTFLASMATTMHWSPNFSAASLTKARRDTAAVLIDTLSAPEVNSARMSSMVRTPPPTLAAPHDPSAQRPTAPPSHVLHALERVRTAKHDGIRHPSRND